MLYCGLLKGESGVGKELVARQIHELSRRRNGAVVAVNCAALVETLLEAEVFGIEERTATGVRGRRGKFEHADGGTLFLDEAFDLSLSAQAKLWPRDGGRPEADDGSDKASSVNRHTCLIPPIVPR